ncbi:four helix bundle protein [Patescibacteria group bacterium]|nr:four helix bundle protein [Patescibacteria group bacterium]MBU1448920.1 four helix bundle protein [Patescibacteria group bacterium]MBU2613247.1 four helix bundle protein [Patescibacteria group bacterium]
MLQKTIEAYKIWHAHHVIFPRLSRFSLGTKIDSLFTDVIELIFLAGYAGADQKHAFVVRASTKLDLLKFFMQAAWEVRCLDQRRYTAILVPLNDIGKDIGRWQKYLQTKQPPPT